VPGATRLGGRRGGLANNYFIGLFSFSRGGRPAGRPAAHWAPIGRAPVATRGPEKKNKIAGEKKRRRGGEKKRLSRGQLGAQHGPQEFAHSIMGKFFNLIKT